MVTAILSSAAFALALVSFLLNYRSARASDRRARMPVLVFVYDEESGWLLKNVGNGPALNVEVAQKIVRGERAGTWVAPVRVPPIARDKQAVLSWLGHDNDHGLGAVYEDFLGVDAGGLGRTYTVTSGNDRNTVRPGRHLPMWTDSEITAQWKALPANEH
ncbi:hypothetical protein [Nocardia sp. NPDC059229]|uniref:hypothetical protein n=1 Tax=Nocardia sp. NPDC059229 TaxID=3346778 RepID=UPI0036A5AC6B